MNTEVDARGLNCPLPVIHTKKALDHISKGKITTIVDNEVAKENIKKLAKSMDLQININENKGDYYIDIFKDTKDFIVDLESVNMNKSIPHSKDLVILISTDRLGEGADELGRLLMKSYLYALTEVSPLPTSILLLNSGVNLAIESSEALEHLRSLESLGVEILSCGMCLDYYKVKDQLAVGGVTNMYAIVEKLNKAYNTIKL